MKRREWISNGTAWTAGTIAFGSGNKMSGGAEKTAGYEMSLAQWSHHRALKGGTIDNLDWPAYVKKKFNIDALEWVNQFFFEKHDTLGYQPKDEAYLKEMRDRCDSEGIKTLLIMCDRVGNLGDPDSEKRARAVEGHFAWLDAASILGGHSIRVNAASAPNLSWAEQAKLCADGLSRLSREAKKRKLNVIVENHGGLSSNGAWLAEVMKTVAMDNCGTLPDFGNFYVARNRGDEEKWKAAQKLYHGEDYTIDETGIGFDRYRGVELLMPFAKGVSAKSHDFDNEGFEVYTDFHRMMKIVKASGYQGHIGVEYEGSTLSEDEGIEITKRLLHRVFQEI